jgi:hypothetical protein
MTMVFQFAVYASADVCGLACDASGNLVECLCITMDLSDCCVRGGGGSFFRTSPANPAAPVGCQIGPKCFSISRFVTLFTHFDLA